MKTARFTEVVAAAGAPRVHSLWLAPGKDPTLMRAVRERRVMTIHQMLRGTKKDYGTVGLQADHSSQVLVFPKSLRRFGEARIVGIDYTLIVQPDPKDPAPTFTKAVARKPPPPTTPVKMDKPRSTAPSSRQAAGSTPRVAQSRVGAARATAPPEAASAARPPKALRRVDERELQPPPTPPTREELLTEIRRAVRELKAGKAVAAHERLKQLADRG